MDRSRARGPIRLDGFQGLGCSGRRKRRAKNGGRKAQRNHIKRLTILCILVVGITADSVNARWHTIPRPDGETGHRRGAAEFYTWRGRRRRRVSVRCCPLLSFDQAEVRWPFRPAQCLTRAP